MSANKTIFLNTIFLYFRMILIIGISLYTTRIVFNTLGVENFGLFNLIAGFVVLFTFLNSAMRSGTQRYLNVGIASGNKEKVNDIFCIALNIHIIIAIIILLLLETIGLWFLNNKLNYAADRIVVANIVYQCAIATTLINVLSIPYQSIILAKEKMKFYAYIGIFEALAKLVIVFLLVFSSNIDVLTLYSILLVIVAVFTSSFYYGYVFKNIRLESKYQLKKNKPLMKEMVSFSGWNLFGQMALLSSNQGKSILFNIFFGVTINASIAIANQINALVHTFISNLQTAFNPQIVHSFSNNHLERHSALVLNSSRYSLYLITLITIPFLLYSEFILRLWLGDSLPQYTIIFSKIIVLTSVFEAISGPFWMSAHAIGNIRKYQLIISSILLINLPITYFCLYIGQSATLAFSVNIFISIISLIYRIYYFFNLIKNKKKDILIYFKNIFFILFFIFFIFYLGHKFNHTINAYSPTKIIISLFILELIFIVYIYKFCISKTEINIIKSYILNKKK